MNKLTFGTRPSAEQMKSERMMVIFQNLYGALKTPMTLCEGLEIIAANPAATKLLEMLNLPVSGTLINQIIHDQVLTDRLFGKSQENVDVVFQKKQFSISSQRWEGTSNHWLLEWHDQTSFNDLSIRLQEAESHDPTTGTLLPGKFSSLLLEKLETLPAGIFAHMKLADGQLNSEYLNDCVIRLVDRIGHAFGGDILISRSDTETLTLFMRATSEDETECSHVLRQLNRIGEQVLAPHQPVVALASFPSSGRTERLLRDAAMLALNHALRISEPTVFTPALRDAAERRLKLAADFPDALSRNEITPYFQPIIDSTSGTIKSFEALVRWIHDDFGYIIPPDIIDISQGLNLLHALTAHMLQQTIRQMKLWPSDVQFAVNVTPSQLTGDLVNLVRQSVREAGIDPGRLEIEVTEDALIENFEHSAKIFSRLRSIGVTVAMDDFGAGYTSVGNLRKLDFDKIKIDKIISDGLPHDKKSVAIVKSVMFMAKELDLKVTVEGIEEEDQLEFLKSFDCGIQGFVFARPMPAVELPSLRKFLAKPSVIDGKQIVTLSQNHPKDSINSSN